uniref:Sushi domain-containing protein n=1 Tax=Chrysemys picta bellii TaxID=8478 RepID=A0A8C3HU19_CHRPI
LYGSFFSCVFPFFLEGCGVPTRLSFAELKSEYKNQSSFPVGKTINYTCRPGYSRYPRMQSTITCLENRKWSEPCFLPVKSCGHPGEPENGRVIITDLLFGSTVNFTCILCLPPPDIPNGRHTGVIMDGFSYGSSVTYKCDSGYPLTGEASIHCTTKDGLNGEWSARPPRCGEVRCPAPQIRNGRRVSGDRRVYSYKDSVTFECNPGYTMKGHSLSQCQTDDTWDPPLPVCEPGKCQNSDLFVLYIVVFECDHGFTLRGSPETQCQDDGRWDPPVPVCERSKHCMHSLHSCVRVHRCTFIREILGKKHLSETLGTLNMNYKNWKLISMLPSHRQTHQPLPPIPTLATRSVNRKDLQWVPPRPTGLYCFRTSARNRFRSEASHKELSRQPYSLSLRGIHVGPLFTTRETLQNLGDVVLGNILFAVERLKATP